MEDGFKYYNASESPSLRGVKQSCSKFFVIVVVIKYCNTTAKLNPK